MVEICSKSSCIYYWEMIWTAADRMIPLQIHLVSYCPINTGEPHEPKLCFLDSIPVRALAFSTLKTFVWFFHWKYLELINIYFLIFHEKCFCIFIGEIITARQVMGFGWATFCFLLFRLAYLKEWQCHKTNASIKVPLNTWLKN